MISVKHLRKEFPEATPLKDVCTEIEKGDVISIIGPSGTGKSTLLRCLNLLEKPTSGEILLEGEPITEKNAHLVRRRMGMVFQSFNLFPHMTVIENIMKGPVELLGKVARRHMTVALSCSVLLALRTVRYVSPMSSPADKNSVLPLQEP